MLSYSYTYVFIFFVILLLAYYLYHSNRPEHFENKSSASTSISKYYKCAEKPVSPILEEIFKTYGITHVGDHTKNRYTSSTKKNMNWELYIPCGYNFVEHELPTIQLSDVPSQLYIFGINGCDKMVSKNNIWSTLKKHYGFDEASQIMPASYVLEDRDDMALFKRDYQKDHIYILKKNVQRKEGLKLTKDYDFITKTAASQEYKVVQTYMRNLYLINGRKVNLRVYLLIVLQGDQRRFYISTLGKCIYTNKKYNDNDFDFESNITSYHLDMSVYKDHPRTFEELRTYIQLAWLAEGQQRSAATWAGSRQEHDPQKDPNAPSLFFVKMNQKLQKMCSALSHEFYQSENIRSRNAISFQLFGVDVIMNDQLEPYILEVNKGPDMSGRDDVDKKMKYTVQAHMFEKVGLIKDEEIASSNVFFEI